MIRRSYLHPEPSLLSLLPSRLINQVQTIKTRMSRQEDRDNGRLWPAADRLLPVGFSLFVFIVFYLAHGHKRQAAGRPAHWPSSSQHEIRGTLLFHQPFLPYGPRISLCWQMVKGSPAVSSLFISFICRLACLYLSLVNFPADKDERRHEERRRNSRGSLFFLSYSLLAWAFPLSLFYVYY